MNKDKQQLLFEEFPELFSQKDLPMTQTCMCWGIDTDDGWFDIIREVCQKIQKIETAHRLGIQFTQVKEKFGELRMYITWSGNNREDIPYSIVDEIYNILEEATKKSLKTCEVCGNPGRPNVTGWIKTLCEKCEEDRWSQRDNACIITGLVPKSILTTYHKPLILIKKTKK